MKSFSARAKEILNDSPQVHLATLMPDGEPKVEPVWVEVEGDRILVATDARTIKARNVALDERVALSTTAVGDPYEQVLVRGRVAEVRDDSDLAVLDRLAAHHLGEPFHRRRWSERVVLVIEPSLVRHYKSPLSDLASK